MRIFQGSDRSSARLTQSDPKSFANEQEGEGELVDRLNANPELLLQEPILLIGHEHGFDIGRLDLLALDAFANTIVFEVKTGESGTKSASEATILSQPQYYASRLSEYDYDALNEVYQQYRDRVNAGHLATSAPHTEQETLSDAFTAKFGTTVDENEYNTYQRMAIVAEEITSQTEKSVRYLQQEGLNLECLAVKRFHSDGDQDIVFGTSQPVSYPLTRVKPDHGEEGYYDLITELSEMLYYRVEEVLNIQSPEELSKTGRTYLEFGPRTTEDDPMDRIRYGFDPHFARDGKGTVYVGVWGRTNPDGEKIASVLEEHIDALDGFSLADGDCSVGMATPIAIKELSGQKQSTATDSETMERIAGELEQVITTVHPILQNNLR